MDQGPFGGGKTHTAFELPGRLPGSVVCDPEHAGFGLHRMTRDGCAATSRSGGLAHGVVEVLDLVLPRHPGPAIAPLTLVEPGISPRSSAGCATTGTTCATAQAELRGGESWTCAPTGCVGRSSPSTCGPTT